MDLLISSILNNNNNNNNNNYYYYYYYYSVLKLSCSPDVLCVTHVLFTVQLAEVSNRNRLDKGTQDICIKG